MYTATEEVVDVSLVEFKLVPCTFIPEIWEEIEGILNEKGERMLGVYSVEEVFRLLCTGILDVWLAKRGKNLDGIVFCGWEVHTKVKYYHILYAFGNNMKKHLDNALTQLEKYAYLMGAYQVVVEGRFGWKKVLEKKGYRQETVRLRKGVIRALGN